MGAAQPTYSFDTSALIDGLERYHPTANFPALWNRIDDLIDAGRLIISEEVWHEVEAKTMTAKVWCSTRLDRIVVPTDGTITAAVQQVLADHPRLVMNMKGRNRADPFVIALASVRGATVVTGEGSDGTDSRPKIPYICGVMGLLCITFLGGCSDRGVEVRLVRGTARLRPSGPPQVNASAGPGTGWGGRSAWSRHQLEPFAR